MRITVVDHPLLASVMTEIRDAQSPSSTFVDLVERATYLLLVTATAELPTVAGTVRTPLGEADCRRLASQPLLVPILRAGLGMLAPAKRLLPEAAVDFVGLRRNEATARPSWYLDALPEDLTGIDVIILEPMIATGGTLGFVLNRLAELGAASVTIVSLICAPAGLEALRVTTESLPTPVHVVVANRDPALDENHFIVPGLGDAGDRLFGEG